ncbi:MAG: 2-C-methyl-D-erythritol 2,4-cyclodiphosphate synthase [Gammaproteobacteria bacterium RIFCSPLOWO2_02_FULL_47_50]|nr:MAG: 2-C-methyl-D-erythritol 2,4-cyclodiphosphate synthase [Gammaproteobacteria bacterium RIFCSPLOWO2_12_47_11]OGT78850.1 MAG: 2-C-methyl-D-erythritol 2,4-cyclodiphosphate synthase [Gammaproteobacteria bacterium RIFCSPLOWO2_02_FULL_47_50]
MMRIGHGYDAHTFAAGRPLILGGVTIPYEKGLAAHSDGDAVIHALCDALLGAAALGDIGSYFPDSDAQFKNIDSRILLRKVIEIIHKQDLKLINADITIQAQAPKMAPYFNDMRKNLADDLNTKINNINIKATTTEGMGFIGRKEGIAVHVVVLLE